MSSTLLTEVLSLIFRLPQAHDDNFLSLSTGLTEDSTGTVFLSVTANDAGKVKSLYSIDDGGSWMDVLQLLWRDTARTEGTSIDSSNDGAKIWITTDGRVAYDASTWSDAFRTEIQQLAAGEYAQDDFIYAIQLSNGALSWAHVTLQIAGVNDAPIAAPSVDRAVEGGALVTGQVHATDVDHGAILTYGLVDPAPAGLQLTVGGAYTFDPTVPAYDHLAAGATEKVVAQYRATDEHGATGTSTLTITVTGTNDAPVAVADTAVTAENQKVSIDVLANDTDPDDGHVLTLASATAPDGKGAVSIDGNMLVFDPGTAFENLVQGQSETVRVSYTIHDEHGAASSSFVDVTVTGKSDAGPVAVADTAAGGENQVLTVDVLANDTEAGEGHTFTLVSTTAPEGKGTASIDANKMVFDPGTAFDHLAQGDKETVRVSYTMQDEHGASSSSFVDVTLMGENDAPVAAADTATVDQNQSLGIDVLANDTDVDDNHVLTVVSAVAPDAKGTVTIGGNLLVFDPGTAFDHLAQGATETVRVAYTIQDEYGAPSSSFVDVTVTGENDAPVAVADTAATSENQSLGIDVLANDTDVDDGHVLKLVNALAPDGKGTATIDGNSLVFDPGTAFDHLAQGESETVRVAYTIQDEHGAPSSSFVDVTVAGENDAPIAVADVAVTGENQGLSIDVLANDTDVDDGHVLTLVSAAAPEGEGTAGVDGNSVVFDPGTAFDHLAQGESETVTLNYSIIDEHGAASSATVQLTILGQNDAPVAAADTATVDQNQRLAIDVLANDTDADDGHVLTLVSAAAPDGKGTAAIDKNMLVFDGGTAFDHLAQGESETVRVAYTMQDEYGAPSSSFVDVTVTGENDAPVAVADSATGGENDVLSVDVLANDTDVDDGHVLTVIAASTPTGFGSASVVNNQVVFDPGSDFDRLAVGTKETVQVSYTMQDEHGAQATSSIAVTLNGVNDAPVARDDAASTDEDTAVSGNVLTGANGGADSDVDQGDVLSVATAGTFTTALGGTITLSANGAFTYDPTGSSALQALNAGQNAVDTFKYSVSDGNGGTDSATLSVTVAGVDEPAKGSIVLSSIESDTPLDYYIRFDGDGVANSWLKLGGFTDGLTAADGSGGKVIASDVQTQLGSSSAMPNLVQMLGDGTHLKGVEIEAYVQGTSELLDQYVFSDAVLTQLQASDFGFGTADSVSFNFGGFAHSHQELDASGSPGPVTSVAWNLATNAPATAPAHTADALSGTLADEVPTDASLSYFMTYDGAPGWLQVSSFSSGVSGGSSPASAEDAVLTLGSSSELVQLTGMLLSGKELKGVQVEAYRMDGTQPHLVDEYNFQNVTLSGLATSNATQNQLSFNYAQYAEGHIAYDANGAPGTITTGGWDFTNNTAFSSGTPVADAIGNQIAGGIAPDTSLDYYIRFDGAGVANSWLKLGSFDDSFDAAAGAGQVSASAVDGMLGSNAAMPDLFEMLANGTHLNGVEIEAYNNQGTPQLVDQYFFSNAVLTDLQVDGSADSVNFDFTGLAHSHQEIDAQGVLGPVASVGWDFLNAAPGSVPAYKADAATAKLADSLSTDVPLKYFMTYDGAPGWLEVSSFQTGMSGGNGQATPDEAMVTLGSSNQLVQLTGMLLTGQQLNGIEVEAYRMDGAQPKLVDEYKFQDVTLTNLAATNANANGLSFDYAKYAEGHIGYNATTGAPTTITTGGWDFSNNVAFSAGTPVADAIGKQLTGGVAPGMDGLDYYIRFDTAGVLNNWLKLDSFSQGFAGGPGASSASDVAATLGSNSATPSLIEMLASGTHLNGVEIEAYRDGTTQLVDQYFFSDAAVTGLGVDGSAGFTLDSVNFNFGGFAHSHQDLDANGAPGPVASVGWDFVNAGPDSVPAHTADALNGPLADALPTDAPLSYFVTYAGAPGWLQASSFSTSMSGDSGQATADDVMLALGSSKQLVELTQALLSGKHLSSLEVEAYRMDGAQPQLVDDYQFQDVILNGLSTDGSATQNTLSFSYAKYAEGHIAYDANGAQSTITTGGWDFTHNTVFDGGTPHADIDFTA